MSDHDSCSPFPKRQRTNIEAEPGDDLEASQSINDQLEQRVVYCSDQPDWEAFQSEFNATLRSLKTAPEIKDWWVEQQRLFECRRQNLHPVLHRVESATTWAEALGIPPGTDEQRQKDQRKCFLRSSRVLHPDKHPKAPDRFTERLVQAFYVIEAASKKPLLDLENRVDLGSSGAAPETKRQKAQRTREEKEVAEEDARAEEDRRADAFVADANAKVTAPERVDKGISPWKRPGTRGTLRSEWVNVMVAHVAGSKVPAYGTKLSTLRHGEVKLLPTERNVLLVEAGCGAQKTRTLLAWVKEELRTNPGMPILFIVSRKTHADDTAHQLEEWELFEQLGFCVYLDAQDNPEVSKTKYMEGATRLIVSLQSLMQVDVELFRDGLIVIDEIRSAASIPGSETLKQPTQAQAQLMILCARAKYRIFLDADISADGAVEELIRMIAPYFDVLHVQVTKPALHRIMSICFSRAVGVDEKTGERSESLEKKERFDPRMHLWLLRAWKTHMPIKRALERIGKEGALNDEDVKKLFAAKDLEAEALRVMRRAAWPQHVLPILARSFAGWKQHHCEQRIIEGERTERRPLPREAAAAEGRFPALQPTPGYRHTVSGTEGCPSRPSPPPPPPPPVHMSDGSSQQSSADEREESVRVDAQKRLRAKIHHASLVRSACRDVGRVLIACSTTAQAGHIAALCDKLGVSYHCYLGKGGTATAKEKREHFKNTTKHWWQAEVIIATTTLCVAVDVKVHFACAFLIAKLSEEVAKLRELLQELVRVGRSPDDPLEEERIFTLIQGTPPDLSKYESISQEKRFYGVYKDLQSKHAFVMNAQAAARRVYQEQSGLEIDAIDEVPQYDEPCLRLTAWNHLETQSNQFATKLVELCKLLTRQWEVERIPPMTNEDEVELVQLEALRKDTPVGEEDLTEDQQVGKMTPKERYVWRVEQLEKEAERQAGPDADSSVIDQRRREVHQEWHDGWRSVYSALESVPQGDHRREADKEIYHVVKCLGGEMPPPCVYMVLMHNKAALLRRAVLMTVPKRQQQLICEHLRGKERQAHPMVEAPIYATTELMEKLVRALELPSMDALLQPVCFSAARTEWVRAHNRLARGEGTTADELMKKVTFETAKLLEQKGMKSVTKQMSLQTLVEWVLTHVCAMRPGKPKTSRAFVADQSGEDMNDETNDTRPRQLMRWEVEELLPDLVPKLRLDMLVPDGFLKGGIPQSEWKARFDRETEEHHQRQQTSDMETEEAGEQAPPPPRVFDGMNKIESYNAANLERVFSDLKSDDSKRSACVRRMESRLKGMDKETAASKRRVEEIESWLKALRRCAILQKGFGEIRIDCTKCDAGGRLSREVQYEYKGRTKSARRYAKGKPLTDSQVAIATTGGKREKLVFSILQGFLSDGRAALVGDECYDIDCENGDPRLIVSLAEQFGYSHLITSIIYYVEHRGRCLEAIMQRHSVEKDVAKRLPNTLCYGGSYKTWRDNFDLQCVENTLTGELNEAMKHVLQFGQQMRAFMKKMFEHERFKTLIDNERKRLQREGERMSKSKDPEIRKEAKNQHQIESSLMSIIMQTCEDTVLGIIDKTLFFLGWDGISLIFDGLLAKRTTHAGWIAEHGRPTSLEEALAAAQRACEAEGWKCVLAEKPLHGKYQTADDPLPTIVNARRAMRNFEALESREDEQVCEEDLMLE